MKAAGAEFFWNVLIGPWRLRQRGAGGSIPRAWIGLLGVSLAFGMCLTLIHLTSIPVTRISANPACSSGVALFAGGVYLMQ